MFTPTHTGPALHLLLLLFPLSQSLVIYATHVTLGSFWLAECAALVTCLLKYSFTFIQLLSLSLKYAWPALPHGETVTFWLAFHVHLTPLPNLPSPHTPNPHFEGHLISSTFDQTLHQLCMSNNRRTTNVSGIFIGCHLCLTWNIQIADWSNQICHATLDSPLREVKRRI